jgi:hypothetical protein
MKTYPHEDMRMAADNIDANHPGWWKEAEMLRQGAADAKRLEWLLLAIPRHAFIEMLPEWHGDLATLVAAIDTKMAAN